MKKNRKDIRCPLCNSSHFQSLDYGGYFYNDTRMPLVKCKQCSLKFIVHNLSNSDINLLYQEEKYFDSEYAGGAQEDYVSNKKEMKDKAVACLSIIRKYKKAGRILDIGCAGGYFLETARDMFNYVPVGIELSEKMCKVASALGFTVYQGSIDNLPKSEDMFDIVYMGDILEHVSRPNEFMEKLKKRVKSSGLIVAEVPLTYNVTLTGIAIGIINFLKGNVGSKYFLPVQHRGLYAPKAPYHLLMFNRKSLKELGKRNKLHLKYLKFYDGKPKNKFTGSVYHAIKRMSHFVTYSIGQNIIGDRAIAIYEVGEDDY